MLELRQITTIFAVESVIWRTEVSIASLIRARIDFDSLAVTMSAAAAGFTGSFEIVAADKAGGVTEKWDPFVLLRFFG